MFLDLRAKFHKLKKKTQNSRKKLKLWEDFAPPERPSGTQPLGGRSLPFAKLKKKTITHEIYSSKLKIFKGVALFIPFLLTNIFKNAKISKNLQ